MDLKLHGLTALVTGGSSGIGKAIVQALINEGCSVAFCSRCETNIKQSLQEIYNPHGVNIITKSLDVRDRQKFKFWLNEIGKLDIFIPNVSALSLDTIVNPLSDIGSISWNNVIETDLTATVELINLVTPFLEKSHHAAITYISSIAGSVATRNMPSYGAIKAALNHYMKSLSKELITKQIRVNVVSPGDVIIEGGFWDKVKNYKPDMYQKALDRNIMGRLATAKEIANVVTFISSPMASFVCGANWIVDGNSSLHVQ